MNRIAMLGKWFNQHRSFLLLFLVPLITISVYLAASWGKEGIGFPLDDAWIHQTYARNLAQYGQWAYFLGKPSAGSTSPLWSAWLAMGYGLRLAPFGWAFFSGFIGLFGIAYYGEKIGRQWLSANLPRVPWLGIFLASEWHLVWAAVSGMETLFYALAILFVFYLIGRHQPKWLWVGLGAGVSVWLRPDGITLSGPALFCIALSKESIKDKLKNILSFSAGMVAPIVIYLFFQNRVGGTWLPNTFFAKQAEYAVLLEVPFLQRFIKILSLPLIGAGLFLLPGFFWSLIKSIRRRQWALLAMGLWWLGYSGIYALRLPVTYQHGRYLIPAMPVYFLLGCLGLMDIFKSLSTTSLGLRVLKRTWILSIAVVGLSFFVLGASSYANDVAIIETEMVQTSRWIADNIEPEAKIAAHDIGALGYFGKHDLIDLAGLVSPEVIPFIRDERKLAEYLDLQNVEYLVTFPGWYPLLVQDRQVVYQTKGEVSPAMGGENMTVYIWNDE